MKRHSLWLVLLLACAGRDADRLVLRVGTSGDYAPFSMRTEDGRRSGFDVEIARAYARERGLTIRWLPVRWTTLDDDFAAGRFDVVMSGVTVRPERALAGRFSVPVATSGAVLLTRGQGEPERIVVNAGGHLERVARRLFPAAALRAITPNAAVREALLTGKADAAVTDTLEVASWLVGTHGLRVLGPFSRDWKAYWLPAGAEQRAHDLDAWLLAREADGTLAALRSRHLPETARFASATPLVALGAAIEERLALMPFVAEAKRQTGMPVQAPAQESAVIAAALASLHEAAAHAGVPAPSDAAVGELFAALIEAAREVQQATLAGTPGEEAAVDLESALRPALARVSQHIVWLLVRLPERLDATELRSGLGQIDANGFEAATRERIVRAILALRA